MTFQIIHKLKWLPNRFSLSHTSLMFPPRHGYENRKIGVRMGFRSRANEPDEGRVQASGFETHMARLTTAGMFKASQTSQVISVRTARQAVTRERSVGRPNFHPMTTPAHETLRPRRGYDRASGGR